jgi:hypothetical protein
VHAVPATIHDARNQLMLDDMPVLVAAARSYRAAAAAAGVAWPEQDGTHGGPPPTVAYRLFDVDHVPEQLTWLQSQGFQDAVPRCARQWSRGRALALHDRRGHLGPVRAAPAWPPLSPNGPGA